MLPSSAWVTTDLSVYRLLLSGRDGLLSRFSLQLRPISLADVLGFVAFGRKLGIGLLGVGFEQLLYLLAAIHGCMSALSYVDDISARRP